MTPDALDKLRLLAKATLTPGTPVHELLDHIDALEREKDYAWDYAKRANDVALEMSKDITKLKAFKTYVHTRLDDAGVPADPDSPHKAEGCRIGGRLDYVLAQIQPKEIA